MTVTAPTASTSARIVADLTGLRPSIMASLSVYGSPVGTNTYLVVRTRRIGSFVGGRWHVSLALTPQMWSWFSYDVAHRGGAHVLLVQGSHTTSAMLTRKERRRGRPPRSPQRAGRPDRPLPAGGGVARPAGT